MGFIRYFKINLRELMGWFVIFGIFLERYYEMAVLFVVLLLIFKIKSHIYLNRNIIYFILILALYSFICLTLINYEYNKFVQQILLLSSFIICYSAIFNFFRKETKSLFAKYLLIAYYVSILGLIQFLVYYFFRINIFGFLYGRPAAEAASGIIRITSVIDEPSNLSTLLTPALVYYIFRGGRLIERKKIVIFVVVFLTFSTITYVVTLLAVFYKYSRTFFVKKNLLFMFLGGIVLVSFLPGRGAEKISSDSVFSSIIIKVQDSYNGLLNLEPESFELLNGSSYATMTNLWVSLNAPNRLIGTGLGTHEQNYYKEYKSDFMFYGMNAKEGYSLVNRFFSEFGFIGLLFGLWWLYKNRNSQNDLNTAAFFLILTLMIRGGHYVRYGFIFWMFLYFYSSYYNEQNEEYQ